MWLFISIVIIFLIIFLIYNLKSKRNINSNYKKESGILANNILNSFPSVQIVENKDIIPNEKIKIKILI